MISRKLLYKIASLYYVENLTQQQIADRLNISRSNISRCLKRSQSEKIVEIKLNNPDSDFSDLEVLIENKYKLNECIIVPSSKSDYDIYKNMAKELGFLFDRVLKPTDFVGVNWGNTLKETILNLKVHKKPGIKIIPMMGGLGKIDTGVQSNLIAGILAEKLGGTSYPIHFPAFLDSIKAKKALENENNYKDAVKTSKNITWALLGMSSTEGDNTLLKIKEFSQNDMDYLKELGIVGDINLNWLNIKGMPVKNRITERTLLIPYEQIRKIKNVIGVAYGKNKLQIIMAVLCGNLISNLITDENTARLIAS